MTQFLKRVSLLLASLCGAAGLYYWLQLDNIHTLAPAQFYRSAQLNPDKLTAVTQRYKIRSVVNLRGSQPGIAWYDQEVKQAEKLGLRHYDLRLQAHTKPSPESLRQLMHILQQAPKPILIHCKGGADRTGLASALALLLQNKSFAEADRQISWRYFAFARDSVGRLVMPYYQCYLKQHKLASSQRAVLRWSHQQDPYACLPVSR